MFRLKNMETGYDKKITQLDFFELMDSSVIVVFFVETYSVKYPSFSGRDGAILVITRFDSVGDVIWEREITLDVVVDLEYFSTCFSFDEQNPNTLIMAIVANIPLISSGREDKSNNILFLDLRINLERKYGSTSEFYRIEGFSFDLIKDGSFLGGSECMIIPSGDGGYIVSINFDRGVITEFDEPLLQWSMNEKIEEVKQKALEEDIGKPIEFIDMSYSAGGSVNLTHSLNYRLHYRDPCCFLVHKVNEKGEVDWAKLFQLKNGEDDEKRAETFLKHFFVDDEESEVYLLGYLFDEKTRYESSFLLTLDLFDGHLVDSKSFLKTPTRKEEFEEEEENEGNNLSTYSWGTMDYDPIEKLFVGFITGRKLFKFTNEELVSCQEMVLNENYNFLTGPGLFGNDIKEIQMSDEEEEDGSILFVSQIGSTGVCVFDENGRVHFENRNIVSEELKVPTDVSERTEDFQIKKKRGEGNQGIFFSFMKLKTKKDEDRFMGNPRNRYFFFMNLNENGENEQCGVTSEDQQPIKTIGEFQAIECHQDWGFVSDYELIELFEILDFEGKIVPLDELERVFRRRMFSHERKVEDSLVEKTLQMFDFCSSRSVDMKVIVSIISFVLFCFVCVVLFSIFESMFGKMKKNKMTEK